MQINIGFRRKDNSVYVLWQDETLQAVSEAVIMVISTLIFCAIFLTFNGCARWLNFSTK